MGLISKTKPLSVEFGFGLGKESAEHDSEGRLEHILVFKPKMKNEQLPEAIFAFSAPDTLDLFSAVSDQFVNIEHGIYNILCFKDRFFNIEKLLILDRSFLFKSLKPLKIFLRIGKNYCKPLQDNKK